MVSRGRKDMGRFSVEIEIANYADMELARRGALASSEVRRETIQGVVDSGAATLVLPEAVVKRLGLPLGDKINVKYVDGRRARRRKAEGAYLRLQGRDGTFNPIVEPRRENALIGAIVLEDLDFLVDCQNQRLVPRDPSGPLYEIE